MIDVIAEDTLSNDIADGMRRLFATPVAVAVLATDPRAIPEHSAEARAASPMHPARRAEFLTGRRALRQALGDVGIDCGAIPVGACRAPVLPGGAAASLTHADGVCVAVAARGVRTLGIDLERARPLPLPDDLLSEVLTPEDRARLARLPGRDRDLAAMQVFSCKEAFYKAQFPVTGLLLGFDAVDVAIEGATFTVRLRQTAGPFKTGQVLAGRTSRKGRFVLSGLALEI